MPLQTKRKPFLTIKNRIFQSKKKIKGVNLCYWPKMPFLLYFDLIKIRLEIMLSDFEEKKEIFWSLKKQFFKVQKIAFFQRG